MAWVLEWKMRPANLVNPGKKQAWGREDLLLLVVCGVWGAVGVQRHVISLAVELAGGWTGALALGGHLWLRAHVDGASLGRAS